MEKQTVSGWWTPEERAWVNQVWNWVKGEGSSWGREREPLVYWSARGVEFVPAGATTHDPKRQWRLFRRERLSCITDKLGVLGCCHGGSGEGADARSSHQAMIQVSSWIEERQGNFPSTLTHR